MSALRSQPTRTPSTLIGAAGIGLLLLASARFHGPLTAAQHHPRCSAWPPHPSDIVNLTLEDGGSLDVGKFLNVFTVPADKWLVVTDAMLATQYELVEELNGQQRVVLTRTAVGAPFSSYQQTGGVQSSLGYAFRPGSIVQIRAGGSIGYTIDAAIHNLSGYLVDV